VRLKRDQINEMLMHYLRVKLDKLEDWREFELKCLEFYHSILEYLESNLDMWNDIQQQRTTTA
jgi:hypothetical protein